MRHRSRWSGIALSYYAVLVLCGSSEVFRANKVTDLFYFNADTCLNTCILQWNLDSLRRGGSGFTEAPIFFPCPRAKFYSEHLLGHMIYALPLSFFVKSPYWLLIGTHALNLLTTAFATFLLALEITSLPLVALLTGGLLLSGWPMGQLQNTSLGWAILTLLFVVRHVRSLRWRDGLGIAFFGALTGLSSGYFAFYTPVAAFMLLGTRALSRQAVFSRLWLIQLSVAALLISLSLLPTMLVYKKVHDELGLRRSGYVVKTFLPPFLDKPEKVSQREPASDGDDTSDSGEGRRITYIAFAQILLFFYGVLIKVRGKSAPSGWHSGFWVLAVMSFWMASVKMSPYALLRLLPGFDGLRAVHRWVFFCGLGVSLTNAMTVTYLLERRPRPVRFAVFVVLFFLPVYALGGGGAPQKLDGSVRTRPLPESHVYEFLEGLPAGPVCILPAIPWGKKSAAITSIRMLHQLSFKSPMVSGYSGFAPRLTRQMEAVILEKGLCEEVVANLARTGVRYLVVDNLYGESGSTRKALRSLSSVRILYDNRGELIAELPRIPAEKDMSALMKIWRR